MALKAISSVATIHLDVNSRTAPMKTGVLWHKTAWKTPFPYHIMERVWHGKGYGMEKGMTWKGYGVLSSVYYRLKGLLVYNVV